MLKPLLFASSLSGTLTDIVYKSSNISYNDYEQTLSIKGANNSYPNLTLTKNRISFRQAIGIYGNINTTTLTQSQSWSLPNDSGTIALTSNIPTSLAELINDPGYAIITIRDWTAAS